MDERTVIDGSLGEGGGQVLRTALALAALLSCPVEIRQIRANRSKPGLRPQHLAAVRALARISQADIAGDRLDSTTLVFSPGRVKGGSYRFPIVTAGSVTMLIAAILPPLLFADRPSVIEVEGGTHVPLSPVLHYLQEILFPVLRRMGGEAEAVVDRWGWYPAGGGRCTLRVTPCRGLTGVRIPRRGQLKNLNLLIGLAGLPLHIAEREERGVRDCAAARGRAIDRRFEPAPSLGQGNVLFLRAEYEESLAGFSVLGRKGWPAEQVAGELCRQWLAFEDSPGSVDRHLADQLLLYMALAGGPSLLVAEQITGHLTTNIRVIEQLLPVRFRLGPAPGAVTVTGIGYRPGTPVIRPAPDIRS